METITRKTLLYKTGVEYGDYAINHVLGCSHGCKYCYAMKNAIRFGQVRDYDDWCKPKLVSNALELLEKELPRLKDKIKNVHLCFTTDPFMFTDRGFNYHVNEMTRQIMERLYYNHINFTTLTKGVLPLFPEDRYKNHWNVGITVTHYFYSSNNGPNRGILEAAREYEPGAYCVAHNIKNLYGFHHRGFKTWVSMEPWPTPNIIQQDIMDVLNRISFVDRIVFGRMNYVPEANAYPNHKQWYHEQAQIVRKFCTDHGIECIIKKGTELEV